MKGRFLSGKIICSLWLCLGGVSHFAAASKPTAFDVRAFGATGDGKSLDSAAINRTIDAAARSGGGTVRLPAGIYLCGSIHLQSGIHLLLESGATILGTQQDWDAYDETEAYSSGGYQDGGHCYFHNSLIWGENLTDVSITGQGSIDGGGLVSWDDALDKRAGFERPNREGAKGAVPIRLGNKAIALKRCRQVRIQGITIRHGGHFAILATGCGGMTIDHVTIDTNRDGIDLDCCRDVIVSHCRVNSPNDDGICLKSSYALGEVRLTENVAIVGCQVSGFLEGTLLDGSEKPAKEGTGRIKFGTESSGGFRNCEVSDCTFRSCRGLALEEVDGGILENITANHLSMTGVHDYAIYITTGRRDRTPNLAKKSRARNIRISHMLADGVDAMSGIQIMGLPEQPIEGVQLEDIRLISRGGGSTKDAAIRPRELGAGYPEPRALGTLPAYGIMARHVRALELTNIRFSFGAVDSRPAAFFAHVDGLKIDRVEAQLATGVLAAFFSADVRDVAIANSPAFSAARNDRPAKHP